MLRTPALPHPRPATTPLLLGALLTLAPPALVPALAQRPADPATSPARSPRLAVLESLVRDDSARVRLEAVRALARIPNARAADLALSVLDKPMDPALDYALWLTINELADPWIKAVESGEWKPDGRDRQLEFALAALPPAKSSRILGTMLARRPISRDGAGRWIELIGNAGSPDELGRLFDRVLAGELDPPAAARALQALAHAARARKALPTGDTRRLANFLATGNLPEPVVLESLRLGLQWKSLGTATGTLLQLASAPASSDGIRTAALEALRATGGSAAADGLATLAGSASQGVARQAASALASVDLPRAVPLLLKALGSLTTDDDATAFWRSVLPVKGAGKAVAEALPTQGIPPVAARSGMRVAREGGRHEMELVVALARGAGLTSDAQNLTSQLIGELAQRATQAGNPVRGEMIYRKPELACVTCHAIGGAGGKVGPDMTSIGASAPADYLVEAVLLPNAKIKEGYHALAITTRDGQEISGVLVRESGTEVVLRNAANAEVVLPRNGIESRQQAATSLMPGGLLDNLPEQDQLDLFAFLSRLGKPGDFDASRGGTARRWRLANLVHTDVQNGEQDWVWKLPLEDRRWAPTYSLVSGQLPRPLIEEVTKAQSWTSRLAVFAATEIQLNQPARATFQLTANPMAELWIDGTKIGGAGQSSTSLPQGLHRVLVKLDPKNLPETLRLDADVPFVLN